MNYFNSKFSVLYEAFTAAVIGFVIAVAAHGFIGFSVVKIWTRTSAAVFLALIILDCRFSKLTGRELGLDTSLAAKKYIYGLVSGILSLCILLSAFSFFRLRCPDPDFLWSSFLRRAVTALFIAVAVSTFEEFVFRGYLFSKIKKYSSLRVSFWAVTVIFALLHLVKPVFIDGEKFLPEHLAAMFGITAVSYILMDSRIKTGNLFFPMGIHAGWVFIMKTKSIFLDVPTHYGDSWFLPLFGSTEYFEGGLVSCLFLVAVSVFLTKKIYPALQKK
ncbi:MAG: CPBP family intramembrane metalloprotease [Candidatus Aureabacteria bacterium]|nr:CPBP family intramembrane metalloprotease [Candidatus Auribacterota bacterium]